MDKKEILNEWLRQTDQTHINEGHKIVILNAMEEYAMQQVKNCSIPNVVESSSKQECYKIEGKF